jgi:hypothetical protein
MATGERSSKLRERERKKNLTEIIIRHIYREKGQVVMSEREEKNSSTI